MKLFIPEISTIITLSKDWHLKLYCEHRNTTLAKKLNIIPSSYKEHITWPQQFTDPIEQQQVTTWNKHCYSADISFDITLESNTQLRLDRIYIRKGKKDFSSLSFWIINGKYKGSRFWAKLEDCNNIELLEPEINLNDVFKPLTQMYKKMRGKR